MPRIDFRSDTVTRPTPAMRQAMAANAGFATEALKAMKGPKKDDGIDRV